jgi:hypothetical protein
LLVFPRYVSYLGAFTELRVTELCVQVLATVVEFQGTIYRNLLELHDAIAEQWVSASGTNTKASIITILEALTDEQLCNDAIEYWSLEDNENVSRQMLVEAFARLRAEICIRFPNGY